MFVQCIKKDITFLFQTLETNYNSMKPVFPMPTQVAPGAVLDQTGSPAHRVSPVLTTPVAAVASQQPSANMSAITLEAAAAAVKDQQFVSLLAKQQQQQQQQQSSTAVKSNTSTLNSAVTSSSSNLSSMQIPLLLPQGMFIIFEY